MPKQKEEIVPRKNIKPWVVYAEPLPNQELPGLYEVEKFMDREMADAKAKIVRRAWEGRLVDVRHFPQYPVPNHVDLEG
jgi:hypothetical protein